MGQPAEDLSREPSPTDEDNPQSGDPVLPPEVDNEDEDDNLDEQPFREGLTLQDEMDAAQDADEAEDDGHGVER